MAEIKAAAGGADAASGKSGKIHRGFLPFPLVPPKLGPMDFKILADIPVIDGHVHFSHLQRMEDMLELMKTVRLDKLNLVSLPDSETINHNAALLGFKAHHRECAYICGTLDYVQLPRDRVPEILAAQVATLKAVGFDGLKLIEGKPSMRKVIPFRLDSPEYEKMWGELEKLGMPVVLHAGDPEEFWDTNRCPAWARSSGWNYSDGTYPSREQIYAEVDHLVERHPGLRLILAHFYFLSADLQRASAFLDAHANVSYDLTPGVEMYGNFSRNHDAARRFFVKYQDRLIYGTDVNSDILQGSPLGRFTSLAVSWLVRNFLESDGEFWMPLATKDWLAPDLDAFRGLGLPRPALERIYSGNFQRLFGCMPVGLDTRQALAELERVAAVIDVRNTGIVTDNPAREVARWLREGE
jgi:hypothetical protein